MRPPSPTRRRPMSRALEALGQWLILLTPIFLTFTVMPVHADDTVRRAQEELRKRNLYFGDIDGVPNRGTVGALRRYQERKRLAVTGQTDPETLHSLGIPPAPTTGSTESTEPDPWPEVPVLRSDLARRPPPLAGETIIAEDPPDSGQPGVDADHSFPTKEGSPPPLAGATAARSGAGDSSAPSEREVLTSEAARAFIENYLRDGSSNDLRAEMSYYAEKVDYFNKGVTSRDYIRRDVSNYYKRWPERHYELIGPVTTTPGAGPKETEVRFQIRFRCRGNALAEGRTENFFTLRGILPKDVRIIAMKEQRLR